MRRRRVRAPPAKGLRWKGWLDPIVMYDHPGHKSRQLGARGAAGACRGASGGQVWRILGQAGVSEGGGGTAWVQWMIAT